MPAHYDSLYPGPADDDTGAPTWFCLYGNKPATHDWRSMSNAAWNPAGSSIIPAANIPDLVWVQVRNRPPIATDTINIASTDGYITPVTYGDIHGVISQAVGQTADIHEMIARTVWATLTQAR